MIHDEFDSPGCTRAAKNTIGFFSKDTLDDFDVTVTSGIGLFFTEQQRLSTLT